MDKSLLPEDSFSAAEPCKIKLKTHVHDEKCLKKYLKEHPLFKILGGHPLSISMIAPLLADRTIKDLFQMIFESPLSGLKQS